MLQVPGYFYHIFRSWLQTSIISCAGLPSNSLACTASQPGLLQVFLLLQTQNEILKGNSTPIKTRSVCTKTMRMVKVTFHKIIIYYFSSSQCLTIALVVVIICLMTFDSQQCRQQRFFSQFKRLYLPLCSSLYYITALLLH